MCNGTCADPTSDPQHCGSCTIQCPAGVACEAGICGRSLFRGAGSFAPCASKIDGSLWCWGGNSSFQDGIGKAAPSNILAPVQASVLSGMPARYTASTGYATCAFLKSGQISCFGANTYGEAGDGVTGGTVLCGGPTPNCNDKPVFTLISNVVELSGAGWWNGGSHSCARTADRKVSCWGDQGCCGSPVAQPIPTIVDMIDDVAMLASGAGFDCALRGDGTVWCWGNNGSGQLGQGDLNQYVFPAKVKGLTGVTIIGAGLDHACARAADGLYCWGNNFAGAVGNGATDGAAITLPAKIVATGLDDVVQMAGGQASTCALTAAGNVFCWGLPSQVGNGGAVQVPCNTASPGNTNMCVPSPAKVNVTGAVEIAFGDEFAIVRLANGQLWAWGGNTGGQIGTQQATDPQIEPIQVMNFP
jgi:alpha-tubulin suppressor-like RCC1 family protein